MLIEQTTTYAYKLKYLDNPTFDKVKTLAKKFIDELPKELVDDLFNAINRGVDILKTEPEMLVYLYSFGNMHKAKLDFAFDKIPEVFFSQTEINIIDYGCGQAIGTMCYADFLKSKNYNQKIISVTLIEPSKKCLRRAALHTSIFLPDAEITTVNKTFDELAEEDINSDEDVPTLHILSNVLDLEFNIRKFTMLVKGRLNGYNQFVCVEPYFGYGKKDFRMEDFAELVGGDISFSKTFGKGEFVGGKNWTCQVVVASVGVLEEYLSTEVTEEDLKNGVEDDYGVVYSKDGKRLLKWHNVDLIRYKIKDGTKVICNCAFGDEIEPCEYLQQIIIPQSVEQIGESAFASCTSLEYVNTANFVTIIGDCAFHFCKNLREIVVPIFITSIGDHTFAYCESLQKVKIIGAITRIGNYAFTGCKSLQQITIPDTVTSIGDGAFCYCNSLRLIIIPEAVTTIGSNPFRCSRNIKVINKSPHFIVENDFLIDNSLHTIISYLGKSSIVEISNTIKIIGESAFENCTFLKNVIIPNSVTKIAKRAFACCESLTCVTIPDSVINIGSETFESCRSLKQINIPNSVSSIGDGAFRWCYVLSKIVIPINCDRNFKLFLPEDLWDKLTIELQTEVTEEDLNNGVEDEFGMLYSSDGYRLLGSKYMICHLPDIYYIKEGTKVICNFAFNNEAFYQNGMTVSEVVIPDSVVRIGDYAFGNCSNLKVEIPQNIETMGKNPFENSNLKSFNSNSSRFVVENDLLIDNQSRQIISYIGKSPCVDIPDTITSIGDYAFSRCTELRLVTIPNSVKSIGEEAFCNCYSLIQITIPKSVVSIGKGAFYDSALQEMTINNPKLIIGDNAFFSGGEPSFQLIIIPEGSEDHFKAMLPEHLWKCLYHLKKVFDIKDRSEEVDDGLPF